MDTYGVVFKHNLLAAAWPEATLQSIDARLARLVELAEKAPAAAPVKPPRATKEADKAPAKEPEKAPEPKTNEPDPFDDTPSAKPVTRTRRIRFFMVSLG